MEALLHMYTSSEVRVFCDGAIARELSTQMLRNLALFWHLCFIANSGLFVCFLLYGFDLDFIAI